MDTLLGYLFFALIWAVSYFLVGGVIYLTSPQPRDYTLPDRKVDA
jgi:hypothetical protein